MRTGVADLLVFAIVRGACLQGTDWLRTFPRDASLADVLNALRLIDIRYLRWLLHDAYDPIFPTEEILNLRVALMEYQNATADSRIYMINDCQHILEASPVNLDMWEKRVLKYEAENSDSWAAFKQTILPDLAKWLERL